MGKKKTKVKWTAVKSLPLNYSSRNDSGGQQEIRGRDAATANVPLPPRFERKAALEKNMVYYDGQFCETEELPNGFVKVRSKHLDVLFKRDFYTKKMERIFNSRFKQTNNDVLNAKIAEAQDEMASYSVAEGRDEMNNYSCHNSSDGSIIYNIDHLLISSNVSFETSTNHTENQSANTSLETDDVINDFRLIKNTNDVIEEMPLLVENVDDTCHDSGFAEALLNHPSNKTRHDSGFIDSSINIPSQSMTEETDPSLHSQFLWTPGVYVYIPSGNELIPCEEVFVSPPSLRDPRCTCAPPTRVFLTGSGQNNLEPFQAGQPGHPAAQPGHPAAQPGHPAAQPGHPAAQPGLPAVQAGHPAAQAGHPAAPGLGYGPHLYGTGNVQNDPLFNCGYNNFNIPTDYQPQLRCGQFAPNCSFLPFHLPDQDPSRVDGHNFHAPSFHVDEHNLPVLSSHMDEHKLHAPSFHMDGHNLHVPSSHMDGHNPHAPSFQMDGHNLCKPSFHMDGHNLHLPSSHMDGHNLHKPSFHMDGHNLHAPSFQMDGHEAAPHFDGSELLLTSEPNSVSSKPNTYQLFPVDEKLHPVFGFSTSPCNDDFQPQTNRGHQGGSRKVIEPDHDWIDQLEIIEKSKNFANAGNISASWNMEPYFKQEIVKAQVEDPSLKSPIPGLPLESLVRKKAQKKKKKRKRKNANDVKNIDSSDETGTGVEAKLEGKRSPRNHRNGETGSNLNSEKLESHFELTSEKRAFEIELSDALASSLVDPLADYSSHNIEKKNVQEVLVDSMADLIFDIVDEKDGREHGVVHQTINNDKDSDDHRTSKESKADVIISKSLHLSNLNDSLVATIELSSPKKVDHINSEEFPLASMMKKGQNVLKDTADVKDEIGQILVELITAAVKFDGDSKEDQHFKENKTSTMHSDEITGNVRPTIVETVNTIETKSKDKSEYIDSHQNASKISNSQGVNIVEENVEAELPCSPETSNYSAFQRKEKRVKAKNNSQITTSSNKEIKRKSKKARKRNPSFQETANLLEVGELNKKENEDRSMKEDLEKGNEWDEKAMNHSIKKSNFAKRSTKKGKTKSESVHRVIIDDSKVEINYSRQILSSAQVLEPERIKIVQTDSFDDNIFVESLGLGMDRGWMTQGRLSPSQLLHPENLSFGEMRSGGGDFEKENEGIPISHEQGEGNGEIGLD